MDVSEIVDRESFQRWLEALPRQTDAEREQARRWAMVLAHRAAMRVLPEFWLWAYSSEASGQSALLPLLRSNHINLVTLAVPESELRNAAIAAVDSVESSYEEAFAAPAPTAATIAAAWASVAIKSNTLDVFDELVLLVASFATRNLPQYMGVLKSDCTALVAGNDPFLLPLWPTENPLTDQWSAIRTHPSTQSPGWRFWIDWYERALNGQPQDWPLLEKIALIDPKDWDKGADHVNALILQMVEQHALLLETFRLKAENERLVEQLRALEHRSHNHPPELVDDLAPIRSGTTVIWAALDDAERELGKTKPDKGALRKAAEALLTASKAIGGYCLRLADTVAQGAARAAGAAIVAGLGIAGLLSSFNADLATLAQDLLRFAASLFP